MALKVPFDGLPPLAVAVHVTWDAAMAVLPTGALKFVESALTEILSLCDGRKRIGFVAVTVVYRDRVRVSSFLETGAEVTSNGSLFLKSMLAGSRGYLEGFFRRDRDIEDRGMAASYALWRGLTIFGAGRQSEGRTADQWYRGGITIPIARVAQVSIDQTRARLGRTETVTHAASVHLPIGPVQVFQRFQTADSAFIDGDGVDLTYRQVQSSVAYSPARRVHLSYQVGTQWYRGGDVRQFNEVQAALNLSGRTGVRVTAELPDPIRPGTSESSPDACVVSLKSNSQRSASCPRTSPDRLTPAEVRVIEELVTSPDYRHIPTGTLAVLAQRQGRVWPFREIPKAAHSGAIFSPSSRRATNRSRSSIM